MLTFDEFIIRYEEWILNLPEEITADYLRRKKIRKRKSQQKWTEEFQSSRQFFNLLSEELKKIYALTDKKLQNQYKLACAQQEKGEFFEQLTRENIFGDRKEEVFDAFDAWLCAFLREEQLYLYENTNPVPVSDYSYPAFLKAMEGPYPPGKWTKATNKKVQNFILDQVLRTNKAAARLKNLGGFRAELSDSVNQLMIKQYLCEEMQDRFPLDRIRDLIMENPIYTWTEQALRRQEEADRRIMAGILERIPDRYPDLYPLARTMERHFIIHEGGTNSGKTYQAIEALKSAASGVYLAPLRLLAYEVYEKLMDADIPCRMKTGEEEISVEGAMHQASTVEMCDFGRPLEVAVIDEAQMLEDRERGGRWTAAILGVPAKEIHICTAAHATNLVIRLIEACGDSYEVVHHERQTPLYFDRNEFVFPKSVRSRDALIVFSKKNVLACAADLQRRKIKCSVVYGALPYDVRREEVRKFIEGENDVVVATDAIGMGMNLPIRRIVFLETEKYDGEKKRPLKAHEVQQIGGRAGRRGCFDIGYVTSEFERGAMRAMLQEPVEDLTEAYIPFPESLIGIDGTLSEILERWQSIPEQPGFKKTNLEREIKLCKVLETSSDDKELIYRFVTIPFEPEDNRLYQTWLSMFQAEVMGEVYDVVSAIPWIPRNLEAKHLRSLEDDYRFCDLLYCYADRYDPRHTEIVSRARKLISEAIIEILSSQRLLKRRCKACGQELSWNYPYNVCRKCFEFRNRRRRESGDEGGGYRGGSRRRRGGSSQHHRTQNKGS